MYVTEGFRADLILAEPDLHQPVAFAFDARGRIWVAEAYSYPQKRPAGEGLDKIVCFEDKDGDGRFESRKVFAEGLNLVSGIEIGYGGVWIGAAPQLLFIPDRNGDDVPDGPPEVLLEGFGYQDTHECLNSFLWGPDGWLYGNQGVFNYSRIGRPNGPDSERVELRAGVWRYHPVRHQFEVFAHGGSNQWGLDYDEHGQLFMTHCRSYWGRGLTTHVIQGGHFWNQANANYPAFIVGDPPEDFPGYRNYLLASARYDHGAGGAGPRGSDAIYGGHSHVGTMIYLGDNWPDQYRGHLFTHNLGGHQINQQVNRRMGSGFDTVHAGRDLFFCSDPKYVAVDLQYGPDGAVYIIDWYDQQHCHNPNTERWDRSNGRLYRLAYTTTYKPTRVDLTRMNDAELVSLLERKNEWYVRTARRVLAERAQTRALQTKALKNLDVLTQHQDPLMRLRALWTTHTINQLSAKVIRRGLADPDEYVRAWTIQLSAEQGAAEQANDYTRLAQDDPSPVVRLYLASAIQRLPKNDNATAWQIAERLCAHGEDRTDRNLPYLLWHSLAPRVPANIERAFALAEHTLIPQLDDFICYYAATLEGEGLNRSIARLQHQQGEDLRRRLTGLTLALDSRDHVSAPAAWAEIAPALYANKDQRIARQAEQLAATFGDESMFPRLRTALEDPKADAGLRQHAFRVLSRALDQKALPIFIRLLDEEPFRKSTIGLLGRFDDASVAEALISRFNQFKPAERTAALNALCSRATFALALLDAVQSGQITRDQLTAFHIRQLTGLKNPKVDERVTATWGRIKQTATQKQEQINRLQKIFEEAPLWAYDAGAGRQHFQKLCAQCHQLGPEGTRVGPELTGAGRNGIRYFLENIIDPNAVVGTDFQMTTVDTRQGEVISGLIVNETDSALQIQTTTAKVTVAKKDIAERATSENSLMPEGLLDPLSQREQIELLKFLTSN
jgi:putative membrane-bound dehydrogenase-like protein